MTPLFSRSGTGRKGLVTLICGALAAGGLVVIMIGATVVNLMSTMPAVAIVTVILGLLAVSVAYGRRTTSQLGTGKSQLAT